MTAEGCNCSPEDFWAIVRANGQITGDIFDEAARTDAFTTDQLYQYEKTFADVFGYQPKSFSLQARETVEALPHGKPEHFLEIWNDALYENPSRLHSEKFWYAIDDRMEAWKAAGGTLEQYHEMIGKPVQTLKSAIDKTIVNSQSMDTLEAELKEKYGLDFKTVYDGKNLLDWLDKDYLSRDKEPWITKALGNYSSAQALYNFAWSLGHGTAFLRVGTQFMVKPGGFKALLRGAHEAGMKNGPLSIFQIKADYKTQGYYGLYDKASPIDLFSRSVIAQKNLTIATSHALGEDPHINLRDMLFDAKPWDVPLMYRGKVGKGIAGLVRYPINESRWIIGKAYQAGKGNVTAATTLGTYFLLKSLLYGPSSNIPSPLWLKLLTKEQRQDIKDIEIEYHLSLIREGSRDAFSTVGIHGEIDPGEYTQPLGGEFAARYGAMSKQGEQLLAEAGASGKNLATGNFGPAAMTSLGVVIAYMNLYGTANTAAKLAKLGVVVSPEVLNHINSTTLDKVILRFADHLDKNFQNHSQNPDDLMKAVFGSKNFKKDK